MEKLSHYIVRSIIEKSRNPLFASNTYVCKVSQSHLILFKSQLFIKSWAFLDNFETDIVSAVDGRWSAVEFKFLKTRFCSDMLLVKVNYVGFIHDASEDCMMQHD